MRIRFLAVGTLVVGLVCVVALLGLAFRFPTNSFELLADEFPTEVSPEHAATSPPAPPPPPQDPPATPLPNPPSVVKALYATSWSAGSQKKLASLLSLIDSTELNAIVVDIKDYSGYVAYDSVLPEVASYAALDVRIPKLNTLLNQLHEHGVYAIARVSVFQDPRLALARPDLALTSSSTGKLWYDSKGLAWVDAAAKPAWDYNIAIAREAFERGFDEVNFDYIRFASDGALKDIRYPFWDETQPRAKVIRDFWAYLRAELPGKRISADLFGLTTVNQDDLGIGQHLEYAFPSFDAIAPMVYPSHYYAGSFGYQHPASHPYEIVRASMDAAVTRFLAAKKAYGAALAASGTPPLVLLPKPTAVFRPWLQDFDLGATYGAAEVRAQIQAVYDAASSTPELMGGWMLWNPSNVYTRDALVAN